MNFEQHKKIQNIDEQIYEKMMKKSDLIIDTKKGTIKLKDA